MATNRKEHGGLLGILRGMVPLEADNTPCFLTAQGRGSHIPRVKGLIWGLHLGPNHRLRAERATKPSAGPQEFSCVTSSKIV